MGFRRRGSCVGNIIRQHFGAAGVSRSARRFGGDFWRSPGEVPADLLTRLPESPHSPPTSAEAEKHEAPGTVAIPRASSGSGGALRTIADSGNHALAA